MLSASNLIESRLNPATNRTDPDTESKVRSSIRTLNETVQSNANEPSLAFYRIQVSRCWMVFVQIDTSDLGARSENVANSDSETTGTRKSSWSNAWFDLWCWIQWWCSESIGAQWWTFQCKTISETLASVIMSARLIFLEYYHLSGKISLHQ